MLIVNLCNATKTLRFMGAEYGFSSDDDGDLEIQYDSLTIARFPAGQWKFVVSVPDEFFTINPSNDSGFTTDIEFKEPK